MSLTVLDDVWGDRSGYVFLPRARHTPGKTKADTWDEGPAFEWPEQREAIAARVELSVSEGWDVYWCPLVFAKPRRNPKTDPSVIRETQGWVYSDLDSADPALVSPAPTILIKSSATHWQAYWRLSKDVHVSEIEKISRGIAYAYAKIGADKSGWDLGQVLRVPGTENHKYDPPHKITIVHRRKGAYEPTEFPDVSAVSAVATGSADGISAGVSPRSTALDVLLKPYKLSIRTKELAFAKAAMGDRSERLWELAKLLIEHGVPVMTTKSVLKLSVWNKYAGRADEDTRLLTDVLKAEADHRTAEPLELVTSPPPLAAAAWPIAYGDFMGKHIPQPSWLVEGIWQKSSYGMISGEPKTYKSVLATDLMLSVVSNTPFFGVFEVGMTGPVLYIQEENPEDVVKDRIVKIAVQKGLLSVGTVELPPHLPLFLSNNVGIDLTDLDHRAQIEAAVVRLKVVLLVLDPLYMMLGNADENNSKEIRPILQFLTSLRNKYGCGTMLIHHFRKAQQGAGKIRGGQRTRGSSIFHGWVESAMYTDLLPDGIRVEREFRAFDKHPDLKLGVSLAAGYYPEMLADESGGSTAVDLKKEELISCLLDKPDGIDFDSLRTMLKTNRVRLQQWLRELKDEGLVETVKKGRGTFYVATGSGKAAYVESLEEESV